MEKPKLLILASGTKDGGGSGFQKLCEAVQNGTLRAQIVGVVSNHEHGGVRAKADKFNVRFFYSPKGRTREDYQNFVKNTGADFVALSGWLGFVEGLPQNRTFNIHPAWLPSQFGGTGFYGHHIHEAVIEAYKKGEATHSGVTMHFVTDTYDDPDAIFFRKKVEIFPDDTAETLFARVNKLEHEWQAIITDKVVNGEISWSGITGDPIRGSLIEN